MQSSAELTLGSQEGPCNGIPGEMEGESIDKAAVNNVLNAELLG